NLYSASGLLVYVEPNGNYATLSDWPNASGTDSNSIPTNPLFLSSTHLHVREPALNNAATPYPLITVDFDGDIRNPLNPDIGADEFDLPVLDAGITAISPAAPFAAGTNDVIAILRNFGSTILTSVTIGWKFDGVIQTPVNWNGSLA